MFTGIIQQTAKVLSLKETKKKRQLAIIHPRAFKKLQLGESIAVDGCCLTVVDFNKNQLSFDISDETLRKTTMGGYQKGQIVNLERALKVGDRLGGHFVLGHVDSVGHICRVKRNSNSLRMEIKFSKQLSRYLIDKGSIAVDGVSLTLSLSRDMVRQAHHVSFGVYIIPHTEKKTNLGFKKEGDPVNLEVDVLGKYVERLILRDQKI